MVVAPDKVAVHHQDSFPYSLEKYGGGTGQGSGALGGAPSHLWWCALPLPLLTSTPVPLDHVQVGTTLGVVVPYLSTSFSASPAGHHHRSDGAPDKGWQCPQDSTPSQATPPFLPFSPPLQMC
jgi:hypothetical protein